MTAEPSLPLRTGSKPPHQTIYSGDLMVAVGITTDLAAWIVERVNAIAQADTRRIEDCEGALALQVAAAVAKALSANNRKAIAAVTEAIPTLMAGELAQHERQVRAKVANEIEVLRDGVQNPDKPYNEAFVHALDCAIREITRGEA